MIPQDGWSEEKLYSYKPGYYVLTINAEFPWEEEFRGDLERYALKRITDERKKDPAWKNPLEIQLHWKTHDSEYRNILFSDLSERSQGEAKKKKEGGWSIEVVYAYKPGHWIIKVRGRDPVNDDFKSRMKDYVFKHTKTHGFEDPVWIELQYTRAGTMLERLLIYQKGS